MVKSVADVKAEAERMLGMTLVTHQTGPEGKEVGRLYVEDGCDIARELYLSCWWIAAAGRVTVMASTEGGMDIEEVAEATPEKIHTVALIPWWACPGSRRRDCVCARPGRQAGQGPPSSCCRACIKPSTSWTPA